MKFKAEQYVPFEYLYSLWSLLILASFQAAIAFKSWQQLVNWL